MSNSLRDSSYSIGELSDHILRQVEEKQKVDLEKVASQVAEEIHPQAKEFIKLAQDLRDSAKNPTITYDDITKFMRGSSQ